MSHPILCSHRCLERQFGCLYVLLHREHTNNGFPVGDCNDLSEPGDVGGSSALSARISRAFNRPISPNSELKDEASACCFLVFSWPGTGNAGEDVDVLFSSANFSISIIFGNTTSHVV